MKKQELKFICFSLAKSMSHLPLTSCHHSCPIMPRGSDSFTQSERYYAQNFPWRVLDAILKACFHQHVQVYRKWRNPHLCKTFLANVRESPPFKSLIRYVTHLHFRNPHQSFLVMRWLENLAEVTMRRPMDPQSLFLGI